ncbi:MAG: hypothetical protein WD512_03225 [Candidatus Paceibacterota bacterium]
MDTSNENKTIIDKLDSVELELQQNNTDYTKQLLKEEGINPEEELRYSKQYMRKIRFMALGLSNKQKDQKLLEIAFEKLKEVIKVNSEKASEALINLLQSRTPSVHYRKLESWSDDEIRDVLTDVNLVV